MNELEKEDVICVGGVWFNRHDFEKTDKEFVEVKSEPKEEEKENDGQEEPKEGT